MSLENSTYNILLSDLLRKGSTVKIAVRGMSMFPFLHTGDVVLVKPAEDSDLKFGRLVVFCSGKNWVVHRLIGQNRAKGLVYTRGDGLVWRDKPVPRANVVGVVTGIEHSRWKLARLAIGRWSPLWAAMAPVTGPLFRLVVWVIAQRGRSEERSGKRKGQF